MNAESSGTVGAGSSMGSFASIRECLRDDKDKSGTAVIADVITFLTR